MRTLSGSASARARGVKPLSTRYLWTESLPEARVPTMAMSIGGGSEEKGAEGASATGGHLHVPHYFTQPRPIGQSMVPRVHNTFVYSISSHNNLRIAQESRQVVHYGTKAANEYSMAHDHIPAM